MNLLGVHNLILIGLKKGLSQTKFDPKYGQKIRRICKKRKGNVFGVKNVLKIGNLTLLWLGVLINDNGGGMQLGLTSERARNLILF